VIYRVFMTDEDYVVIDADSPEEAMLKLRDAGLEPVKAEPFDAHPRRSKGSAPARCSILLPQPRPTWSVRPRRRRRAPVVQPIIRERIIFVSHEVIASALKSLGFPKTFWNRPVAARCSHSARFRTIQI